jgi:hypothetical protein
MWTGMCFACLKAVVQRMTGNAPTARSENVSSAFAAFAFLSELVRPSVREATYQLYSTIERARLPR